MKYKIHYLFLIIYTIISISASSQQIGVVKGTISDEKGQPLPYTNIIISGTSQGTSSNIKGEYQLEIPYGTYQLQFKFIGYKTISKTVNLNSPQVVIDVSLPPESVTLNEVVIKAGDEDPAYDIIRKAQAQRKKHLNELKNSKNKAYVKIFGQGHELSENPSSHINLFGARIPLHNGIFYLSESLHNIYTNSNTTQEVLTSYILMGDTTVESKNRAMFVNFYENRGLRVNNSMMVSPIAEDALSYYNYEYEGAFQDQGVTVNKIKLLPKSPSYNAFTGYVYIIEDSWRLYGLHLYAEGAAAAGIGKIELKVTYTNIEQQAVWVPFAVNFYLEGNGKGYEAYYHVIQYDYSFTPNSDLPVSLKFKMEEDARNFDLNSWEKVRPVPLTDEEAKAYHNFFSPASQETINVAPKEVKASSPKKNKYSIRNYLIGFPKPRLQFNNGFVASISPLISSVSFNTVEGWVLKPKVFFDRSLSEKKYTTLISELRYGFSGNELYGQLQLIQETSFKRNDKIEIRGGHYINQFAATSEIDEKWNMIYSLLERENYLKLYEKTYLEGIYTRELFNGVELSLGSGYANRKPLQNNTDFAFVKNDEGSYTPNEIVINETPIDWEANEAVKLAAGLRIHFKRPYELSGKRKKSLASKWPVLTAYYQKGMQDVDFQKMWFNISDDIRFGLVGYSSLSASYGSFLSDRKVSPMDVFHFSGNRTTIYQDNPQQGLVYQILDYYNYSTTGDFIGLNFNHNFYDFILHRIPLIKSLGMHSIVSVNYLKTDRLDNYLEYGVGLSNILNVFRFDYFWTYSDQATEEGVLLITANIPLD